MRKAKCSFFSDFVKENSNNQGTLFKAIKGILVEKKNVISFPGCNETALVNELGKYFVQKISNIHSEINNEISSNDDGHVDPPSDDNEQYPGDVSHFDAFEPLSDVRKLVVDSHKKSCYLDPVPTDFLVKCLDVLLPVITKIINISLETGYFPRDWKEAIILPILKKSGLESAFENLRPISNLAYISKLIERAVYNQTHDHILRCGFYPVLQSAYRRYHSTETALLKVLNDILLSMNSQRVTLLVLLDLSSAFDTIDHGILLERLRSKFGIRGKVLSWFSSYLSGRSQRVMLNGTLSDSFKFRIHFKLLLLTFKALHGMAPKYMVDLLVVKVEGHYALMIA